MNLPIFITKIPIKKIGKVVVSVASGISMVDNIMSERRKAKEFEDLKQGFEDLSKTVSELQKKN